MPQLRSSLPRDVAHSVAWIAAGLLQLCITACQTNFQRLQRVQNARIVCQAPRRHHHSADLLKDLHWLHVRGCRPLLQSRKTATTFASYTFIYSFHILQTIACSGVICVRPTANTVFIDKRCCSTVLVLCPHRLEVFPYLRCLFRHSEDRTQIQMQIQIQNKNQ